MSPCIRNTLVTGITRYALLSMDSGPNHLADISLDPNYAGICDFTLHDFDSLFSDRLDYTLEELKKLGRMKPSASIHDLKAAINYWYDGYNWGEETRVLNPYSILFFFKNNAFTNYWIQSGRPSHLTSMIAANPLDFVKPALDSYFEEDLKKSDLNQLQVTPVLFHSGYITIDKIINNTTDQAFSSDGENSYSFRLPNHEVSSS